MKKILSYSLVLVSIILLSRCAETEDNIVPPISAADTIITIAERMEVLEACKNKAAELNNLEGLEDKVTYLSWLATQPEFYSYGFAGEDLYAVFQDGRVAFFVYTPLDEPTGGRVSSGRTSKLPANINPQGRVEDLPKSKKVSLFSGMGKLFRPKASEIKSIFDNARAGYEVGEVKDATIANLKAVSGDAVFYIHTHGGYGEVQDKRRGPLEVMALWTKERVSRELDTLYKEDMKKERLGYMLSLYDTDKPEWHYAITSKFVSEYMSFGENCFIYLQACNGFSNIRDRVKFHDSLIEKTKNKKATIVGWTGIQGDVKSGQFIFDRLLAPYTAGTAFDVSQEDPFQRPFDLDQVFADMRSEGLGVWPPNGAQLMYKTTLQDEVLLRPTIESMDIDELTSTLTIKGTFGWDEGSVTVNEVAAVVVEWTPYEIACIIRETGDGSFGDVVVKSPEGIKSNAVPLSEYIIKLNYSVNAMGIKFAGVCTLRLRADVHLRRSKIGETPTKPTYIDLTPLASGRIFNIKGSSAVYTITGHRYDACNLNGCHVQFTESPTPNVGSLAYTKFTPGEKIPLFAMYNWGPEMKTIKLNFITINASVPDVVEERVECPPEPGEAVAKVEQSYGAGFAFPYGSPGSINLEVAENFNIRPGSWGMSLSQSWSPCNVASEFTQQVSWDVIVPNKPPTRETAARDGDNVGE